MVIEVFQRQLVLQSTRWRQLRAVWRVSDANDYWAPVRQRWTAAIAGMAGEQRQAASLRKRWFPFFRASQVPIAITGERGAGKTALYTALLGGRVPPYQASEVPESTWALIRGRSGRRRSSLVVVPGQDSNQHRPTLDKLFSPRAQVAPRGVIHVVTGGYDWVWEPAQREVIRDQLEQKARERGTRIDALERALAHGEAARKASADRLAQLADALREDDPATVPDSETNLPVNTRGGDEPVGSSVSHDRVRLEAELSALQASVEELDREIQSMRTQLTGLREQHKKPASQHLAEHLRLSELERFQTLCRNYLIPAWSTTYRSGGIWIIIAVSKFDLWREDLNAMSEYYVPGIAKTDSPFTAELRDLVSKIGETHLKHLAILPVASFPSPYQFSRSLGAQPSHLEKADADRLVVNLRNVIGELCDTQS